MGNSDLLPEEVKTASPGAVLSNGVEFLQVDAWNELGWLWHGFSTRVRDGGEFNLGFTSDADRTTIQENRLCFAEAVTGSREVPLVTVSQVHSNRTAAVTGPVSGVEADGLVTNTPGILLGILTADCVPVLVADRRTRVVGAFHAGWRGTVQRVVELGVLSMQENFGSEPRDLTAAIGPRIGACCYTVGDEVRERFAANFEYAEELFAAVAVEESECGSRFPAGMTTANATADSRATANAVVSDLGAKRAASGEFRLDLMGANRRQLLAAGLPEDQIRVVGGCTVCHPELFHSHRGSRGRAGRMMAVIGVR